jgi:5-methylcytosine-specific restriction protein A
MKYPCTHPGCSALTDTGGPCPKHKTERARRYDRERGSSTSRGYDHKWRKLRLLKLYQDPLCEDCLEQGTVKQATDVDHKDGDVTNMAMENLRSLCHECHSAKTARENGAFGNPRGGGGQKSAQVEPYRPTGPVKNAHRLR